MEATIAFGIALHGVGSEVAFFIADAINRVPTPIRIILCKIVVVYKVVAGVIGRVDVNHLDLTEIVFAENFQYVEVISLDVKIFSIPEIDRSIDIRAKCFIGRSIGKTRCRSFIRPRKLITFLSIVEHILRQLSPKFVEVDSKFRLAVFI